MNAANPLTDRGMPDDLQEAIAALMVQALRKLLDSRWFLDSDWMKEHDRNVCKHHGDRDKQIRREALNDAIGAIEDLRDEDHHHD